MVALVAEQARERIVDAAEACLKRHGLAKLTLDEVATTAGVHRATVYRHFEGGRDAVVLAVVERDAQRFLDRLAKHVHDEPTLADAIAEAIVYSVEATLRHPILALVFSPDAGGRATGAAAASQTLTALTRQLWEPFVARGQASGEAPADLDLDHLAELVLRLTFSLMSGPSPVGRSREATKEFLHSAIAPVVMAGTPSTARPRSAGPPAPVRLPGHDTRNGGAGQGPGASASKSKRAPGSAPDPRGTKERLFEVAAGVFRKKGYAQTSTREVADELGIRKASLYHHIRTKEDLLEGLCLESLRRITDEVTAIVWSSDTPLRALAEAHLITATRDRNMHLAMLTEHGALSPDRRARVIAGRDAYAELVRSVIVAEQQKGRIRTDIDAKYLALGLLSLLNWSTFWFDPYGERSATEVAGILSDIFLDGAGAKPPARSSRKPHQYKGE